MVLYKKMLPENGAYDKLLRCKIILQAPQQVQVWDENRTLIPLPAEWKDQRLIASIRVKSLYFSQSSFGVVIEAQDVMLTTKPDLNICPF